MLEQIKALIKTDDESQQRFTEIKKVFRRRTLAAAIILASGAIISLFFIIHAYQLQQKMEELQTMVENCEKNS